MTSHGNGQSLPYDVRLSELVKAELKQLYSQASQQEKGQRFLAAFRAIVARLRSDPLAFGEPLYPLPALQLQLRQAIVLPLVVDFAVHEERPLVFIRGFKVLS